MAIAHFAARALRKAARLIDPPDVIKTIDDDYLIWLKYVNAGMLDPGNLNLMDYAISNLPSNAPILEIGSFCGLSANVLTHLKRRRSKNNKLVTCDKWEFENNSGSPIIPGSPNPYLQIQKFVRESYLRNIQSFSSYDLPFTIEMNSDEFFAAWGAGQSTHDVLGRPIDLGGPLSFCYVDGNHTYEQSKRDYLQCDLLLQSSGFVLFDDSNLQRFGVSRLMPEIVSSQKYRLITSNPNHLFQKL